MCPPPNVHEDKQHHSEGDVDGEEHITDPKYDPNFEVECNLSENSSNEYTECHPEAPLDGTLKLLSHIHCILVLGCDWVVRVDICLALCPIQLAIDERHVEVPSNDAKLDDQDDDIDKDGQYPAHLLRL